MEMKNLQMGTDWTYLFDNKAILGRATTIVDTQALRDAEAVIAQTMHGRRCRRDRHLSCSRLVLVGDAGKEVLDYCEVIVIVVASS